MDENLKILLCEDDENLGTLLSEYLQAKGYQADLCPDGEAGYRAFLKNKYDICVLDVMMPKKDGFTLAQEIRQANTEVPITATRRRPPSSPRRRTNSWPCSAPMPTRFYSVTMR